MRSTLLKRYIKINFLAIFLPIAIFSIVYTVVMQNNYREKYLNTVEYSVNEKKWYLDARVSSLFSMAQNIQLDQCFTPYNLENPSSASINAIDRLKRLRAEVACFDEIAIRLNNSEKLYTSQGIVDINTFLQKTYIPAGKLSEEEFLKLMYSDVCYDSTKDGQYVLSSQLEYHILTYPLKKGFIPYGTLIGFYESDWEEFFRISKESTSEKFLLVCNGKRELLYTQMPEKLNEKLETDQSFLEPVFQALKKLNNVSEYYEIELDGTVYIGEIAYLETSDWYLVDMLEEHVVTKDVFLMQLPLLITLLVILLLMTVFLSIVLSVYNYTPIKKLYSLFESQEEKKNRKKSYDEFVYLNGYIRSLIDEKNDMAERLNVRKSISRMELIKKIIRSNLDVTIPEIKEQLSNLGIHMEKTHNGVIVLKTLVKRVDLENVLEEIMKDNLFQDFYFTENVYKNCHAFLACVEDTQELLEFADRLSEQLKEVGDTKIGIGNSYCEVESLKYSLIEAIIAVESGEGEVVVYSDIDTGRKEDIYCAPLKYEIKLKQMLIQGCGENLEEVLRGLRKELLRICKMSSEAEITFFMNRIWASLFENCLSLSIYKGHRYLHYTNMDEFFEHLSEFCYVELNCRMVSKSAKEDSRMESIFRYIDENYMYPEMSLTMVAEEFHMTSAYLSRVFKTAAGKNFIDYIVDKRMELAAHLLVDTDATVGEIVKKVGYSDVPNFTRKFTRHFRITPSNYRKREWEKKAITSEDGGRKQHENL